MKLKVLLMILLVGSSAAIPPPQQPSALATLAASMAPGTWAELPTTGVAAALTGSGGSTGIFTPYASIFPYDPTTKTVHFIGMDHMGAALDEFSLRHVVYSLTSNAWTHSVPPWYPPGLPAYLDSHGYSRTSIDVVGRRLIRTPGGDPVRIMNLDTGVWSTIAGPPEGNYGHYGQAFFPERNSLIYPSGSGMLWERSFTTGLWTSIASYDGAVAGGTWWHFVHNPVRHEVLTVEVTAAGWKMGVLSAAGTFTRLADIPLTYRTYDGSGLNGIWIAEPGGKYLLMTDPSNDTGRNVYEYDAASQVFTLLPNQVPDKHLNSRTNWNAASLPEYNVTLWLWAEGSGAGDARVFLYKHGAIAPPAEISFAEKCADPGAIGCFGFDAQSELRYAYSQNTNPCTTHPPVQPNTRFTNDRLAGEANVITTVQNGQCNYPVVDTALKHSGAGSLKFTIPSTSSDNTSGQFTSPFGGLGTKGYIGKPGDPNAIASTVYMQFVQYFEPEFLTIPYRPEGGWKQLIWYGNPPNGSNSSGIEITHVNGYLKGAATMYGQQGADDYGWQYARGCPYGTGNHTYPEPPCIRFKPGWMEFTTRVDVGSISCYGGNPVRGDTRVRMWVDGQLAIDHPQACMVFDGTHGEGLGQFAITPFQTGKDITQVTPVARTYYDNLIISRNPIPMKNGVTPPPPGNTAPVVSAFSGQTVTAPQSATFTTGVTDDGMPTGSKVTTQWTSIPAGVSFSAPTALTTQATAPAGTFTVRLTATDGSLSSFKEAELTVNPQNACTSNAAPTISAIADQSVVLPATITLTATITDDMCTGGNMTMQWTSSPAGLVFTQPSYQWNAQNPFKSPAVLSPLATATVPGIYTVTLSVNDGQFPATRSAKVTFTGATTNIAPVVLPLLPLTIQIPGDGSTSASAVINAVVSDDGLPIGSKLTYQWSGPTICKFGNPTQEATNVTCPAGAHTLSFVASDGVLPSAARTMVLTVNPAPPPADTEAPKVTFTTATGSTFTSNYKQITFTVTDNAGAVLCTPTVNGIAVQPTPIFTSGGKLSTVRFFIQQTSIPRATYTIGAFCKDAAGNTGTAAPISVIRK